jgi:hypothetical protein
MYDRHLYVPSYEDVDTVKQGTFNVITVPEDVKAVGLTDYIFRSRAGEAEEAWRFEKVGEQYEDNDFNINKNNSDLIRGIYSPYIAFDDSNNLFDPAENVNIYVPGYSETNIEKYIDVRMNDSSSYHAISDRISLEDINEYLINKGKQIGQYIDTSEGY